MGKENSDGVQQYIFSLAEAAAPVSLIILKTYLSKLSQSLESTKDCVGI